LDNYPPPGTTSGGDGSNQYQDQMDFGFDLGLDLGEGSARASTSTHG
jgi:hypothetical protein